MEQFRAGVGPVKINVNDDGYCVELNVGDDAWVKRFLDFLTFVQEKNKEHMDALSGVDDISAHISHTLEFDREVKSSFDQLFGDGAYAETFCVDLAGIEYVVEFLNACLPYVEKRIEQRKKVFEKYDPARKGGAR